MNWLYNIANTISALWNGNLCQSRTNEDKNVVVSNEPLQAKSESDTNEVPSGNNSRDSQKIFSPELMMASSKITSTDWKFPSNPTKMDKLELCKRILKDNFPTDEGDDESKKEEFIKKLNQFLKINTGVCGKLKLQNGDVAVNISNIASQLNGLQKINDEELKERIDIILENLDNKEAFNYYMDLFPKTHSSSRQSSPRMDSSRESSPGILPRGPYSPAGSMTPPSATSKGRAVFLRSPSSISTDSEIR